ncbi:hypothetical protein [Caminibacter sp.]
MEDKLNLFLEEGELHKEKFLKILNLLPYPFKNSYLNEENEIFLDSLAFRFSKLQGLLGEKIFKEYLELTFRETKNKSFIEILRMLEKEGMVDIEVWINFRKVRNFIFHNYPLSDEEKIEAINFLMENTKDLIRIFDNFKEKIETLRKSS